MPKAKIGGVNLYYELCGKGEPLLLIPGLGSDSASWEGVRNGLAKHFTVITFDNRASGRSDTPRGRFSIRDMAGDAAGLLRHLRIKRCHVAGHSMGGYIAQVLAIRDPGRVDKLVLESTAPASSARNNMLFRDFCRRFEKSHDSEELMRSWACWAFSPKTFGRKNFIAAYIKYASAYPYGQSAAGFKAQIGAVEAFDSSAELKKIRAATMVIIGRDDILIYPAESMKLVKGIRGSVLEAVDCAAHCPHVERPDVFISKVTGFLL